MILGSLAMHQLLHHTRPHWPELSPAVAGPAMQARHHSTPPALGCPSATETSTPVEDQP